MPALAAFVIFSVFFAMAFRAYQRVRPFRIETPDRVAKYQGAPWVWLLAVIDLNNYLPEAAGAVRKLWFWFAALQLSLVLILWILATYYP